MTNTDKQPQTVYIQVSDAEYFSEETKSKMLLSKRENVYMFTSEELQALKAESVKELTDVLNQLFNRDAGCPQCDYGVLRKEDDEHWDNCIWNNARKVYEKYVSKPC